MLIVKMVMLFACVLSGVHVRAAANPWEPGVRDVSACPRAILMSTDGKEFPISSGAAQKSGYVAGLLDFYKNDSQAPQANSRIPIKLPATSLSKLIILMEEHAQEGQIKRGITVDVLQEGLDVLQAGDYCLLDESIIKFLNPRLAILLDASIKRELQEMVARQPHSSQKYKGALARAYIREQLGGLPSGRAEEVLQKFKQLYAWQYILPGPIVRHDGPVKSAAFSPDGSRVVTASADHTARMWNVETGAQIGNNLRHDGKVWSVQFSPDGSRVVTASDDHTARIWNAETSEPIGGSLRHDGGVYSAQFSPDGSRIVTASRLAAHIWNAETGAQIGDPLRHNDWVYSAQFSPDGSRVVTASGDRTARIWNAETSESIGNLLLHDNRVFLAQFSPDGSRVVTASDDRTARMWNVETGAQIGNPLRHNWWVRSAQFSPDGSRVVTASWDKTARIWNAETGAQIGEFLGHNNWVNSAKFSPDGSRIVTASDDGTARIWQGVLSIEQLVACIAKGIQPCAAAVDCYESALQEVYCAMDSMRKIMNDKDVDY